MSGMDKGALSGSPEQFVYPPIASRTFELDLQFFLGPVKPKGVIIDFKGTSHWSIPQLSTNWPRFPQTLTGLLYSPTP